MLYRLQQNYIIVFTCKPPEIPKINYPSKTNQKLIFIRHLKKHPKRPKNIANLTKLVSPIFWHKGYTNKAIAKLPTIFKVEDYTTIFSDILYPFCIFYKIGVNADKKVPIRS